MIQQTTSAKRCITYNQLNQTITAAECNSTDPLQKWIWTRHEQIYHVETSKCIQQGQRQDPTLFTWFLGLEECNMSETKQKWYCNGEFIQKDFFNAQSQQHIVYMTFESNILKLAKSPIYWGRYGAQQRVNICSSGMFLYLYFMYVSDISIFLCIQGQQFTMGKLQR